MAESTAGVGMIPVRTVSWGGVAPLGDVLVAVVVGLVVPDVFAVAVDGGVVADVVADVVAVVVDVPVAEFEFGMFLSEPHPITRNDSTIIGASKVGISTTEMRRSGSSWLTLLSSKPLRYCAFRLCIVTT